MNYWRPRRPPALQPKPAAPISAVEQMLIEGEDFANRPWGIVGEPAAPRPPEPPAQVRQPIVVPPPPWSPNYVPELDPDYEPSELREDEESYPAKRKAES